LESRQVIFLTKGYLAGWLTFQYPNKLSFIREQYIISCLDRAETLKLVELRLGAQSEFIAINPKDGGKAAQQALTDYTELALPYIYKDSKIKGSNSGPKTPDEWKAILSSLDKK